MKRVEEDGLWSLMCPDECKGLVDSYGDAFEKLYLEYEKQGKARKSVRAKDLWNTILECQIETGMPYIGYKDSVNKKNMQSHLGVIKNSNLCVAPHTKILTKEGYKEIQTLSGQKVKVWNGESWSESLVQKTGENQKLIRVNFDNNESIECTNYHNFPIDNENGFEMVEAKNLVSNMTISFNLPTEKTDKILNHKKIMVQSIEDIQDLSDTYCFNEPVRHLGVLNGVLTGNCSEISLYSDSNNHAVCTLASICLPKFIENGKFNFEKLQEISGIVTRNLNNVVDVNFYPTPEARKNNLENRPLGIGIQGLADVFCMLKLPFGSKEAKELNTLIFENIYFGSVKMSVELAKKQGPYPNYKGSPQEKGMLQFSFYNNVKLTLPWENVFEEIEKYGMRNSLLTAVMPTASTSQIMGNNECIEAFTTNLYVRKTLSGEFTVVNTHLVNDLISCGLWTKDIHEEIIHDNGSIQKIKKIPENIKELYKTSFEIKMRDLLDLAIGRAPFIDHQQSMNLYLNPININALNSAHFYSWKNGLKTGIYYLHTMPAQDATKFGLDPSSVQRILKERKEVEKKTNFCPRDPILRAQCDSCSA
jgi:ribonucleotide reductase alpha subunit